MLQPPYHLCPQELPVCAKTSSQYGHAAQTVLLAVVLNLFLLSAVHCNLSQKRLISCIEIEPQNKSIFYYSYKFNCAVLCTDKKNSTSPETCFPKSLHPKCFLQVYIILVFPLLLMDLSVITQHVLYYLET